jgi:hypothetical protein
MVLNKCSVWDVKWLPCMLCNAIVFVDLVYILWNSVFTMSTILKIASKFTLLFDCVILIYFQCHARYRKVYINLVIAWCCFCLLFILHLLYISLVSLQRFEYRMYVFFKRFNLIWCYEAQHSLYKLFPV